jgi:hypothetical protein
MGSKNSDANAQESRDTRTDMGLLGVYIYADPVVEDTRRAGFLEEQHKICSIHQPLSRTALKKLFQLSRPYYGNWMSSRLQSVLNAVTTAAHCSTPLASYLAACGEARQIQSASAARLTALPVCSSAPIRRQRPSSCDVIAMPRLHLPPSVRCISGCSRTA